MLFMRMLSEVLFRNAKLKPENFISGNNFARNSDIVYAEAISVSHINKIDKKNLNHYEIINKETCIYSIRES